MILIWYPRCSTCKRAESFLKEKGLNFELRDIVINNPTRDELNDYFKKSKLNVDKLFNTSGLVYKELGLKDKIKTLSVDEKIDLLSQNGKLIKRPILVLDDKVLFGFKKDEWEKM